MRKLNVHKVCTVALAGAVCLAAAETAIAQGREVYYQVTYADGSVRDVNDVPTTRQNIRRVVRISRLEDSFRGHEMLATGPIALTLHDRGRTIRHELTWDSKAWVARPEARRQRLAATPERLSAVMEQERTRVGHILARLRQRLKDHDHAVAEAQRALEKVKGGDGEAAAAEAMERATELRKAVLTAIELYEVQLKALTDAAGAAAPGGEGAPGGRLGEPRDQPPGEPALGIDGEIRQAGTLPHRVQVWKLPPGAGRRTISVAMAHPEAGPFGAFHYVAYADTDGDGLPDKPIGLSQPAVAGAPGDWTSWQFTTDEPVVFVGNAWTHQDTNIYFARPPAGFARERWRGLSDEVYVSGFFGGLPCASYPYGPYLTNIRVRVSNPFGPAEPEGPRIIVR